MKEISEVRAIHRRSSGEPSPLLQQRISEFPVRVTHGSQAVAPVEGALLAVVAFGSPPLGCDPTSTFVIPLRPLGDAHLEVWSSRFPVSRGSRDGVSFAGNGDVLLGAVAIKSGASLEDSVASVYEAMIRLAREEGYPHLVRIWNHLAAINDEPEGLERYKRFSLGRHNAYAKCGYRMRDDLPAASAVGTHAEGTQLYFLSAREPALQIENRRQVRAFEYPARYGPRSPSFSRGSLKEWENGWQIFLSGTASIVGHESRHEGDVRRQLDETLANMECVLDAAAETHRAPASGLADLSTMKVYLRDAAMLPLVEPALRLRAPHATTLFLEADICRSELLIEIEGIAEIVR